MQNSRIKEAIDIMRANDRGGFTIPTSRLYPFQWNWDSAFAALGFATFDRQRAWLELEMLFEGQWDDGMVPHIIFRRDDPDYYPGPSVWRTNSQPPSSGHSQPPVIASIMKLLVEDGSQFDRDKALDLFDRAFAFHQWWHSARDPDGTGLVAIVHPWESGRDNCPDWDVGMENISVAPDLESYQRRDTSHIDASERPTSLQYDRFLTIVKFGRECGWDQHHIYRHGPFLAGDPGIQFILLRADRDLLHLARLFGKAEEASLLEAWIEKAVSGCNLLWNPACGGYCSKDLKTGTFTNSLTSASTLCFWAQAGSADQRKMVADQMRAMIERVRYGMPSWDPREPRFEAKRYWRGPVWAVINFMIASGLAEQNVFDLAERIRTDTLELVEKGGFFEYFNPESGAGLGGGDFTWTAAIYLMWAQGLEGSQAA